MKLNSIQYLRALAVLMVVAFHAASNVGDYRAYFPVAQFGEYGVDLFFVISGLIISVTTASKSSSLDFVWKRLIRIVPLYWTITLTYALLDWAMPGLLRSGTSDVRHLISSLFFIPSYHPRFPANIWPTVIQGWSLNYEMLFYGIFAAVMTISARSQARAVIVIALLLTLIGLGQIVVTTNAILLTYTNPLLLEFVFGIVIGEIFLKSNVGLTKWACSISLVACGAIVLFEIGDANLWRSLTVGTICATLVLLFLALEQDGVRFASLILVRIGDASYAIYLTHFAAVATLRMALEHFSITNLGSASASGIIFLAIFLSCLLGLTVFVFLERPMNGYLRQLGDSNKASRNVAL